MKNKDYWVERSINSLLEAERSVLDYESELRDAYTVALREIQKEIGSFFDRYARDNKLPYAEARKRLTANEKKSFEVQLKEWYKLANELSLSREYSAYIKELSAKLYITRLESLQASIRYQVEQISAKRYSGIQQIMSDNYLASYYSTYYTVASGLESAVSFSNVDANAIEVAVRAKRDGYHFSQSIWGDRDALVKKLNVLLPQSFSRGLGSKQIADQLAKEMNVENGKAMRLVRTEVNYIANQASIRVYKAANLAKYEYLATLDMRTSQICRDMDGEVILVSQAKVGINFPPLHPNCRSTTIPYFEDYEEPDDTRTARDENARTIKVPRSMTQEQWIKKYAPEDQQEKLLKFRNSYKSKI